MSDKSHPPLPPGERNAEIWSTRVQRELLALTTDNAPEKDQKDTQEVLPDFMTVKDHQLDITAGSCIVSFQVTITGPRHKSPVVHSTTHTTTTISNVNKNQSEEGEVEQQDNNNNNNNSNQEESKANETNDDKNTNSTNGNETAIVTITLDASLVRNADGTLNTSAAAYPFVPPVAIIADGATAFPTGSTIQNGDTVAIDCDWTPSLHLSDAVLNIGLKVKESILQQEPFHPSTNNNNNNDNEKPSYPNADVTPMILTGARAIGDKMKGMMAAHKDKKNKKQQQQQQHQKQQQQQKSGGDIYIGQEISLLEPPWVEAQGIYSCKAVRRPEFVEAAIQHAALENEQISGGAGGMFKSFAESAKSVLQESFIMITDTHIIEMTSSKLNLSTGKITVAIPIELMAKLKFRRQESISLFFKSAPNDPLIYMCPDSADAVHQIQAVLKRHGVKGKHTNAAAHRAIGEALQLVQEIQTKELALRHDPSVARVNEIMDLYRQAAERFEAAGDVRHEEVVTHMRKFLALPVTTSILDGSYQKPPSPQKTPKKGDSAPEGEVLEASSAQLNANEEEEESDRKEEDDTNAFTANMDDIVKEAKADMAGLKMSGSGDVDEDDDDNLANLGSRSADDIVDDAFGDLDAMLKEADAELAELMGSKGDD